MELADDCDKHPEDIVDYDLVAFFDLLAQYDYEDGKANGLSASLGPPTSHSTKSDRDTMEV